MASCEERPGTQLDFQSYLTFIKVSLQGKIVSNNREKTASEIRYYKDRELDEAQKQGQRIIDRLTEIQLHNFYKTARDNPNTSVDILAKQFNLSERMARSLLQVARLPHIVADPEDDQLSIAQ